MTQKAKNKNLPIILTSAAIVIIVGGYFGFAYATKNAWPFKDSSNTTNSEDINYSPPTQQEIDSSQDAKKNNSHQEDDASNNAPSSDNPSVKKTISVGIAYAGFDDTENAIDVRAFTPDVIEGDGVCTATFTQGTKTITQSSKAFIDSTSSQCEPILVPTNKFTTKGTWSLSVSYSSSKNNGTSPVVSVQITQ